MIFWQKSIFLTAARKIVGDNRPPISETTTEAMRDFKIVCVTTPVFFAGQAIQHYPTIFPQFLRWHLTNMVDVPTIAIPINVGLFVLTGRSRPITSSSLVFGMGLAYKFYESQWPGHSFDYVDTVCFLGGAAAYIAVRKVMSAKFGKDTVAPR